jgi:aminopeptidase
MLHPLLERYADLLVGYCVRAAPGELVALHVATPALPLARALVRSTLRAGGRPALRMTYPEYVEDVLELAHDGYYDAEPELDLEEVRRADGWIRVSAPTNSRALQAVDKARLARLSRWQQPVSALRVQRTKWVGTLFPTDAAAQDAGMSLGDFERFVFDAMFLYDDDPVARWGELRAMQARLIERLARADEVRIVGPGTDLRLSVKGRSWENSDGRRNMPSGEVFTGPHEDSAEGVVSFDLPSSVGGVVVRGVRLRFEAGGSSRPARPRARTCCTRSSTPTPAPATSASSGSAPTSASAGPSSTPSSTRRSAAPSTSRWAPPTPPPAAPTSAPSTGT